MVNYTYNAWGEIISTTGTLASTIGAVNKLRYRSYYYDDETGFYYLQSRYYDPVVKRFISPDSTDYLTENGTFDGFNLYAYCLNNPVMYSDPSGNASYTKYRGVDAISMLTVILASVISYSMYVIKTIVWAATTVVTSGTTALIAAIKAVGVPWAIALAVVNSVAFVTGAIYYAKYGGFKCKSYGIFGVSAFLVAKI